MSYLLLFRLKKFTWHPGAISFLSGSRQRPPQSYPGACCPSWLWVGRGSPRGRFPQVCLGRCSGSGIFPNAAPRRGLVHGHLCSENYQVLFWFSAYSGSREDQYFVRSLFCSLYERLGSSWSVFLQALTCGMLFCHEERTLE